MAAVDILLPVRNGAAYLGEAIDSVRAQTSSDWRLLVLDHGSTDGSVELAERYASLDRRIALHPFPRAAGLSDLLNKGLALCDCRYVMRHDADDICLPRRIELSLAAFAAEPGLAVVGGQAEIIDADGHHHGELRLPVGSARITAGSLFRNPFCHPALMMDHAQLQRLGARYGVDFLGVLPVAESLRVSALAEDYFLFGQLAMLGKCSNIPERLIRYRWHGSNISVTRGREQMALSLTVSRFLARSWALIHGQASFDPAPFCNPGGRLFDMGEQSDFDDAFAAMAASLRTVYGDSPQLQRELRFRRVLARRQLPAMLARYLRFTNTSTPETGEWYAVKSWLLRHLPGRACMPAGA